MRFDELKAIAQGTPEIYLGRKYIQRCNYRKTFEIDDVIITQITPKMTEDEAGNKTQMLSKAGEPVFDYLIYLPYTGADGQKYLSKTKSPLIWRLIRNLPVTKTEDDAFGNKLEYREKIEGVLMFGEGEYKYGDKTAPVATLEAAEE